MCGPVALALEGAVAGRGWVRQGEMEGRRRGTYDGHHVLCDEPQISVHVIGREPASLPFELAIPPAAGVPIENVDDLSGSEGETGRVLVLWLEIVHGEDVLRFGVVSRLGGGVCGVDGGAVRVCGRGGGDELEGRCGGVVGGGGCG